MNYWLSLRHAYLVWCYSYWVDNQSVMLGYELLDYPMVAGC